MILFQAWLIDRLKTLCNDAGYIEVSRHHFFFLLLLKNCFMIPILLCIAMGILTGYLFRKTSFVKYTGALLSVVIMLLLFFLGASVGSNKQVISNFTGIGLEALLLTVGGTLGSLICAKWVFARFFVGKKNRSEQPSPVNNLPRCSEEEDDQKENKSTL